MSDYITSPTNLDILCGKDKTYNKHPGNRNYRALIEEHAALYANETSKQIKMKLTKDICQQLEASGARFIRNVEQHLWEEITNQQARDKISHALRFCAGSTTPERKKKRTHRRIVSNDLVSSSAYNTTTTTMPEHPFSERNMIDLYHHQQQQQQPMLAVQHQHHTIVEETEEYYQHVVPDQVVSSSYHDLDDILQEPLGSIRDDSWGDSFFPQIGSS